MGVADAIQVSFVQSCRFHVRAKLHPEMGHAYELKVNRGNRKAKRNCRAADGAGSTGERRLPQLLRDEGERA